MLVWTRGALVLHGQKVYDAVVHNRPSNRLYLVNCLKSTCTDRYLLLTFTVYLQQPNELSQKCLQLEFCISKQDGKISVFKFSAVNNNAERQ